MVKNQTELVASELEQVGFEAKAIDTKRVEVSLNRKVSPLKVEIALEDIFGELQFSTQSVGKNVEVSW